LHIGAFVTSALHLTPPSATQNTELDTFQYQLLNPAADVHLMRPIWQLVAGNLAAMGDVLPHNAMQVAKDDRYDQTENTRVVAIYHESGRLAGTFSLTLDGDSGLPVEGHFEDTLQALRRELRLLNGWRFAMSPLYQSARLRQRSFAYFKQLVTLYEADAFVLYFNERLSGYYHRQFKGRVIDQRSISFDGSASLNVNLMVCLSKDNPPNTDYLSDAMPYEYAMDC
jgi:hypothetical protein